MLNKKSLLNVAWLILDKLFLLLGGLLVTIIVAKYLGPENLGVISFGLSLSGIAVTVCQWGASNYIFNESAKNQVKAKKLISSTEKIRIAIYIFIWLIISLLIFFSEKYNSKFQVISLAVFSGLFLGLDIYQYYFNANLSSKINAVGSIISKATSMLMRLLLVYFKLPVIYFVMVIIVNNIILFLYKRSKFQAINKYSIKDKSKYQKLFFKKGTPFLFTAISIYTYMKINEVMLVQLIDYKSLGQFSISYSLSQVWTIIPISLGITLLSNAIKEGDKKTVLSRFSYVNFVMLLTSIPIILIILFFGESIIILILGDKYIIAAKMITFLSIASLLSSLVFINNRIIGHYEFGGKYLFKKSIVSAVLSILFSYYLISEYGVNGAAYSLIIIEMLNLTILNYFFKKASILKIHLNVFNIKKLMIGNL